MEDGEAETRVDGLAGKPLDAARRKPGGRRELPGEPEGQ